MHSVAVFARVYERAFTINLFSFWEIRGISELGSSRLPATENAS